jgi:hypothetical protein
MKVSNECSQQGGAAGESGGEAEYKAYVEFEADANIRLGMAASVVLP